jgi:hypothetical protein
MIIVSQKAISKPQQALVLLSAILSAIKPEHVMSGPEKRHKRFNVFESHQLSLY